MFYRPVIVSALLAAFGPPVFAVDGFPAQQSVATQAPVPSQATVAQQVGSKESLEWVSSTLVPQQQAMSSQQQIQAAFPPTSYGPNNYPVQQPGQAFPVPVDGQGYPMQQGAQPQYLTQPSQTQRPQDDGTRGLFPPNQPSAGVIAGEVVSPFTPAEIRQLKKEFDASRDAKAFKTIRAVPRISSISVDLSPGSSMPIARLMQGTPGSLIFIDSTGAPWPLAAAPRISDELLFYVEWLKPSHAVVISALSQYETGTVTVFLQGLATPVVIQLATGEENSKEISRIVDVRLDVRVPGRGPNAKNAVTGPGKISLYDDTLQAFLDGLPPTGAKAIKANGEIPAGTKVWQLENELFVRTTYDIKSPFDQTSSAANGTRVYRMPITPYVTFSDMGRSVTVQLDIL
ncbi:conjugal transfer protein TraN [Pseudomonas proteolytica]|uniref:DotH/IcmK family type IV secretion protein n=1 Tax=Pseudomonas proteolytica TaxID=219574 RepID=UPI001475EE5B|nr:DotH/IcmK family type IV secretion protein [Pseudomonas proteolytica]NMZ14970.1 conjugal transfer protein TraN [Pseudomonas proteolytica]NMZ15103.1 conjugal transfer protein TraN [Pseudomonas proteolytica]